MAEVNVKRVKSSEIEFKDRLVAINRVTKVTKKSQGGSGRHPEGCRRCQEEPYQGSRAERHHPSRAVR